MVFKRIIILHHNLYIYTTNECNKSLALSLTMFNFLYLCCSKRLFLCLDFFILSLCEACLPVHVKIVRKIVKQLWTQTLHTVVMEFPETRSSILVHTISEMSHTFNVIVVFVCVYPK